jgi:methyl-accepting chemotaxis protein
MSSSVAGQLILIAALSLVALAAGGVLFHRMQAQNGRLTDAIENMSQGLCMFDRRARITLVNRRYLDMYQLDRKVVHPGITLTQLIRARKQTGLFQGDVDAYVAKIIDGIKTGSSVGHVVPAGGGRLVLAKNEVMAGGGWVSTHEDVTEQHKAEKNAPLSAIRSGGAA